MLHLGRHHALVTFLVVEIDAVVNYLTLVVEKALDRALADCSFVLVDWCIEESFIVFYFSGLYGLKSLITVYGMHSLLVYHWLLFLMHLLFICVHLVPLCIRKHVLAWNLLLLFSKSLI